MRVVIHLLLSAGSHRGRLHMLLGSTVALVPSPVAVLAAAAAPLAWRPAVFLTALAVLTAALGLPRVARRISVTLANRLLGTSLPAPADGASAPRLRWPNRFRTSVWLLLHAATGGIVTVVAALVLVAAVALPTVWLRGGDRVAVMADVDVAGGAQGWWTIPAAVALLVLVCLAGTAAAALLRRLAPLLLGHQPAERLAVLEEQVRLLAQRNRLAQELHDSIGHTLTASTIQAAVARELMSTDPARARHALVSLEEVSRAALDDLDHVLGILRSGRAPTAPPLSLADLPALLDRVRGAGTELRAEVTGDLAHVPAAVSREAYRIVQEGLTNALRHASRAPVALQVSVTRDRLDLELTNPLTGRGAPGRTGRRRGSGLTGAAERVALLRGEFCAGPAPDGPDSHSRLGGDKGCGGTCWRLSARIPLRSGS
ncbi:sensor histidine kinase [Streptomyces noursei]|uniref:sensor histidine kinase n=1 Tax=Streptomyces noursei TaxID=1971 RepID=UPI001993C58F|nr:histidine kinase [Streptomyces noursei]MCZ1021081.1 histidine kinase [Streptomyces noursei]GGX55539.1 two-component sensor histidine kinase [Streptomyces noursei]